MFNKRYWVWISFPVLLFFLALWIATENKNVRKDCELEVLKEKMKTYGRIDAFLDFSKSFSNRKFSSNSNFIKENALYLSEVSSRLDAVLLRYMTLSKTMFEIADAVEKQNVLYEKYNQGDFESIDVIESCHELNRIVEKVEKIKTKSCEISSCFDRIVFARKRQIDMLFLNKKIAKKQPGTVVDTKDKVVESKIIN